MPKFVIDEDLPRSTAESLKKEGYKVFDIRDYGLRGKSDRKIYEFAKKQKAVLITRDKGFGNILEFPIGRHYGIVVIDFPMQVSDKEMNRFLIKCLRKIKKEDFKGNLIIIEPGRIRMRKK